MRSDSPFPKFRPGRAALSLLVVLMLPVAAAAQGSIFGTVESADASHPVEGELFWIGFLDDTDEEIRIESNTGAGYDGLYWYDDFQNYTTEAAGNPFDYYFVNTSNGQAFHLAKAIPANSFQEENITLAPASAPARPTGLSATVVSSTRIDLRWDYDSGSTYHVYRRWTSNNGGFRRLDDPTGNLANPGVADSMFADMTSDGMSEYSYIIMAEDVSGNYSAHSAEISVLAAEPGCNCPCHSDLDCDGFTTTLDLGKLIDVLFNGAPDVQDPDCPKKRGDFDCDGFTTISDLSVMTDFLFNGGPGPCDPCAL